MRRRNLALFFRFKLFSVFVYHDVKDSSLKEVEGGGANIPGRRPLQRLGLRAVRSVGGEDTAVLRREVFGDQVVEPVMLIERVVSVTC